VAPFLEPVVDAGDHVGLDESKLRQVDDHPPGLVRRRLAPLVAHTLRRLNA
jgi:hypothetical protein